VVPGLVSLLALSGCGSTGISAGPLQESLGQTFGRLYILQQVELGNRKPVMSDLDSVATCTKGTPLSAQSGAGNDWVCDISYYVSGLSTSVDAVYNLNVQTDGCYAADSDGPGSVSTPVGQQEIGIETRMMTAANRKQVPNPIWLIDGCFDVT
jgi:hypothetical protein